MRAHAIQRTVKNNCCFHSSLAKWKHFADFTFLTDIFLFAETKNLPEIQVSPREKCIEIIRKREWVEKKSVSVYNRQLNGQEQESFAKQEDVKFQ